MLHPRHEPLLLALILIWPILMAAVPFIVLILISWNN